MSIHSNDAPSPWEGLTLNSVKVLLEVLTGHGRLDLQLAERRFSDRARGFGEALTFLEAFDAARVDDLVIFPDDSFESMIDALNVSDQELSIHLLRTVLGSHTRYGVELRNVCQAFRLTAGRLELCSNKVATVSYSARNALIEGKALLLDHTTGNYSINSWFHSDFINTMFSSGPSPGQLIRAKDRQAKLGLAAELQVMEHERRAVGERDSQLVVHVALVSTGAGFDIASVRRQADTDQIRLRLIEVKAVSPNDFGFVFTRNEVQVATQCGSSYFLYLVPVRRGHPRGEEILTIENPVDALMTNSTWIVEDGDWNVRKRGRHGQ